MAIDDSTTDDLDQAIINDATKGISSFSVDGTSHSKLPLAERQEILDKRKSQTALGKKHRGLRFTQQLPPGGGG